MSRAAYAHRRANAGTLRRRSSRSRHTDRPPASCPGHHPAPSAGVEPGDMRRMSAGAVGCIPTAVLFAVRMATSCRRRQEGAEFIGLGVRQSGVSDAPPRQNEPRPAHRGHPSWPTARWLWQSLELAGIDHRHREAGHRQRRHHQPADSTRGFAHNQGGLTAGAASPGAIPASSLAMAQHSPVGRRQYRVGFRHNNTNKAVEQTYELLIGRPCQIRLQGSGHCSGSRRSGHDDQDSAPVSVDQG